MDSAEGNAVTARYKKLLADPLPFSEFTDAAQVSAQATRFEASHALSLFDKTPLTRVLHFDGAAARGAWVAFDAKRPVYMVKVRVFNGMGSKFDVEYSDNSQDWKPCGKLDLTSAEWNVGTWRPAGGHRFWRLLLTENPGQHWFEKFEWSVVPNDVMAEMKKWMDANAVATTPKVAAPTQSPASTPAKPKTPAK